MGTNKFYPDTDYETNDIIRSTHIIQFKEAFNDDVVPRENDVPKDKAGSLGTASLNWENVHTDKITLAGKDLDPSTLEALPADGSITTEKLANGAVTSPKLQKALNAISVGIQANDTGAVEGTYQGVDNPDGTPTYVFGNIKPGSIGRFELKNDCVTTEKIVPDAVTKDKIKDGEVTNAKLDTDAVNTDNIVNGAVTEIKMAAALTAKLNAIGASTKTAIESGATSRYSSSPRFLRLWNDSTNQHRFMVLGATTNLVVEIEGTRVVINTDIPVDLAANDVSKIPTDMVLEVAVGNSIIGSGGKRYGEVDYAGTDGVSGRMKIKTVSGNYGSIWSDPYFASHQLIAFQIVGGSEIILATVNFTGPTLIGISRGIVRGGSRVEDKLLKYEDLVGTGAGLTATKLKVLSLFQVYVDKNGAITTKNSRSESNPAGKIRIGTIYASDTKVEGYRCVDFYRDFSNENDTRFEPQSNDYYNMQPSTISVYGKTLKLKALKSIGPQHTSAGYPPGETWRAGVYGGYITETGGDYFSNLYPIYREDLKGYYHREETWRAVLDDTFYIRGGKKQFRRFNKKPWQRYSPIGQKPFSYSIYVSITGNVLSTGDMSAGITVSRSSTGIYIVNHTSLRLRARPIITATLYTGGNSTEISYVASVSENYTSIYTKTGTNSFINRTFFLTLTLQGQDAEQVRLDNMIGK